VQVELLLIIAIIAFFASTVKSAIGFGEGLVNMAFLGFFLPLNLCGPYVSIISVCGSFYIVIRGWNKLEFKNLFVMVLGSLLFVPAGIYVASITDANLMKFYLGIFITIFSIFSLFNPRMGKLKDNRFGIIFGGMGGFLAGAYNIPGPPVAIYGTMRSWLPYIFRLNLQAYFACTSSIVLFGHILKGNLNLTVFWMSLFALPAVFTGIFIGKKINTKLTNPTIFKKIIYAILTIVGLLMALS
jgi:uncharacterized membrane protein YfcA